MEEVTRGGLDGVLIVLVHVNKMDERKRECHWG